MMAEIAVMAAKPRVVEIPPAREAGPAAPGGDTEKASGDQPKPRKRKRRRRRRRPHSPGE